MRKTSLIQVGIAGAVLLIALVAYVFWYMTVSGMGKEVATLEVEIQSRANESERINDARTALSLLATSEARLRSYFINTEEVVIFLERITATGRALGADVEVVNVQAETQTETRGQMALSLYITGSFDAVMRTVGAIEFGPFDSSLTDITIDKKPKSQNQPDMWVATATYAIGIQNPTQ